MRRRGRRPRRGPNPERPLARRGGRGEPRSGVGLGVVLGQEVLAPVALEGAPDRVDVVGVVLGVVVLDDKARALDRVVVAGPLLDRSAPGEGDRVEAGPLDLVPLL